MNLAYNIKLILKSKYTALLGLTIVVLYFVSENKYLPCLDDPAHAHNAFLLKEYFGGNEVVRQNFDFNTFYTPNMFSTFYMMVLFGLFNIVVAFKIFYFSLLFSLIYSVYYFFRTFCIKAAFLFSLAFIVFFNGYIMALGFYNFSFSVALLLFAISYFKKNFSECVMNRRRAYFIWFSLLFLLYYSNAFSLLIFMAYTFAVKFQHTVKIFSAKNVIDKKHLIKQLGILFSLSLPYLVILYVFQTTPGLVKEFSEVDVAANWRNLIDFSSFIAYDRVGEGKLVFWYSIAILLLLASSVIIRIIQDRKLKSNDIFFLMALVSVSLYFVIPNNFSVGFMSVRLQYFFYLFLLLWLFLQPGLYLKYLVSIFLFVASICKYNVFHREVIKEMNYNAYCIVEADKYLEENKTVAVFNYSGNWSEYHFSNYLGLRKPVIILQNYEAILPWFPLRWSKKGMPVYTLSGNKDFQGFTWNVYEGNKEREIDYIFMYCGAHLIKDNKEMTELLRNYIRLDKNELTGVAVFKRR